MPPRIRKTATVCGICREPEYAHDLCRRHYMQNYESQNAIKIKAQRAQYRVENHEAILQAKAAYREANAELLAQRQREYAKRNPEIVMRNALQSSRTRRARKRNVSSEHIYDADMILLWGSDCYLCGRAIDLLAPRRAPATGWQDSLWRDHVISLARGGSDTLDNVRPTHALCNLRKGSNLTGGGCVL